MTSGGRVSGAEPSRRSAGTVGAGRAAEAEVDTTGMERLERAELLGDHDGRVVREHNPAGADPDRRGARRHVCDYDGGRGARDPDSVVVLGKPEPSVAETLDVPCQVERVPEGIAGRRAFHDRSEVEYGQGRKQHQPRVPDADSLATSRECLPIRPAAGVATA